MARHYRLIVTFDVPGAKSGDARYRKADVLLRSLGDVVDVFKQVRLLTTKVVPRKIAPMVTNVIGPVGSVLVVQVARPYRFVLGKTNRHAGKRAMVESWLRESRGVKAAT
jgi:hypothetical protein